MKSVKWFYVGAMAIALGMLTFATVACHDDDDDPKPAEGEVIETPKPEVKVGDSLEVSFKLLNKNDQTTKIRLEYGIYYQKANGTLTKKVHKISEKEYAR